MKSVRRAVAIFLIVGTLMSLSASPVWSGPGGSTLGTPTDVVGTAYADAATTLADLHIMNGYPDGTFRPSASLTRAEAITAVIRALGLDKTARAISPGSDFADVPTDHWAAGYVTFGVQKGLVKGVSPGVFAPGDSVTYAQAVALLLRMLDLESRVTGVWPTGYTLLAYDLGWLSGITYSADAPASRGDFALMLFRAAATTPAFSSGKTLVEAIYGLNDLVISGPTGALPPGSTYALKAVARGPEGLAFTAPVKWTVQSGDGTVDAATGLFTAGRATSQVRATLGTLVADVSIAALASLEVRTSRATVEPYGSAALAAWVKDSSGKQWQVSPTWAIASGPGSVTAEGNFTAGSASSTVSASYLGLSAGATISVSGSLVVEPSTVTLLPGAEQQFAAYVVRPDGTREAAANVSWKSSSGLISAGGLLSGNPSGPATVTAQLGSLLATATVHTLVSLSVTPERIDSGTGTITQLTVSAVDSAGQSHAASGVKWSATAGLGVVDSDGRFVGIASGEGTVTASYAGLSKAVPVTVAGAASKLFVAAQSTSLIANGRDSAVLTASVLDAAGRRVTSGSYEVVFFVPSTYGTLEQSAVTTSNGVATTKLTSSATAGSFTATVMASGLTGAGVSMTSSAPGLSKVSLSARPARMSADPASVTTITATLLDQTGVAANNDSGQTVYVYLTSGNSLVGSLLTSQITIPIGLSSGTALMKATSVPGTTVVSGVTNVASLSVTPVTITTAIAGVATRVKVISTSSSTVANNSDESLVDVELEDANGSAVTGDNITTLSCAVTGGTATVMNPSVAVSNGLATFRMRSAVAGQVSLRISSGNRVLEGDSATITFAPGQASRLALSVEPYSEIAADLVSTATIVAKVTDANGNLVPAATNTVTFSKSTDNSATSLPATTAVAATGGVARLTVTARSIQASDTFTASAQGLVTAGTVSVSTVITGAANKLVVRPLAAATAGQAATINVWVADFNGRLVTRDQGRTVTLTLTGSTTKVLTAPSAQGVASFAVTLNQSGAYSVTASSDGLTPDTSQSLTVAAGTAKRITLYSSHSELAADGVSQATITARVTDDYGNALGNIETVALSLSNSTCGSLSTATLMTSSSVTFRTSTTPGSVVISGSAGGYVVSPASIATFVVGTPAKVVVDSPTSVPSGPWSGSSLMTVKVRITDANGHTVTGLSSGQALSTVGLSVVGANGTTVINVGSVSGLSGFALDGRTHGTADAAAGVATFYFSNTKAETVTFMPLAYYNSLPLTGVAASGTTLASSVAQISLSPSNPVIDAASSAPVTVSARLADIYGNVVADASSTVNFVLNSTASIGFRGASSVPTVGGIASVQIAPLGNSVIGTYTLTASAPSLGLSTFTTLTLDLMPYIVSAYATDESGSDFTVGPADVGAKVSVTVQSRQTQQTVNIYVDGAAKTAYSSTGFATAVSTIPAGVTSFVGYIPKSALNGSGTHMVKVMVQDGVGISPLYDCGTLTVSP